MQDQNLISIKNFCEKFDISKTTFYEIKKKHNLPKLISTPLKCNRKYISQEALEEFTNFVEENSHGY